MTHDLPPLPSIDFLAFGSSGEPVYDSIRAYALAAIAPYKAEIEQATACAKANYRSLEQFEALEAEIERLKRATAEEIQRLHAENAKLWELLAEANEAVIWSDLRDRIDAALGEKP